MSGRVEPTSLKEHSRRGVTGGALHTVETEDESFDGGGGVWLPRCAGTQAVSAQRVPLAAGGGREGAAAAARTPPVLMLNSPKLYGTQHFDGPM